jgi:ketosteroid isomerase-like protein
MSTKLPEPLKAYFAAKNRRDIDGMLASYAEEATVRDEGQTHSGRGAIRAWIEETTRKYGVTVEVSKVATKGDRVTVAALVSGNFPGSPATLHYAFELSGGRIVRLEIGA